MNQTFEQPQSFLNYLLTSMKQLYQISPISRQENSNRSMQFGCICGCRFKSDCLLVEPKTIGGMHLVRVFLRDPPQFGTIRRGRSGAADSARTDSARADSVRADSTPDSNLNILNVRIFFK